MARVLKHTVALWGAFFLLQMSLSNDLWAFSILESKVFRAGPLVFKMEIQLYGRGSLKKNPLKVSSLKVKIKNTRESTEALKVKTIRAHLDSKVFQDFETKGYVISPGQWVTKYYRLPKDRRPVLGESGKVEIRFEKFRISFNPRTRVFQGPHE